MDLEPEGGHRRGARGVIALHGDRKILVATQPVELASPPFGSGRA